jgi:hypothetical protein
MVVPFGGASLAAQSEFITSVSPDLTLMLNQTGPRQFGTDYAVTLDRSSLSFGLALQRRHFSRRGRPLSYEYGLRLNKAIDRMEVFGPGGIRQDVSLDQFGVGVPLRVFFDGFQRRAVRSNGQSGLFVELLSSAHFGDDVLRTTYSSHLSLGARTRGKRLFYQVSFGWPVLTSNTSFTALDRGFVFQNRQRRFGAVTIGYSLNR